jgi:hypothetical protein
MNHPSKHLTEKEWLRKTMVCAIEHGIMNDVEQYAEDLLALYGLEMLPEEAVDTDLKHGEES